MKKHLKKILMFALICLSFFLVDTLIVKADNIYIPYLQLQYRNSSNIAIKTVTCEDNSEWCYLPVYSSEGTIAMGSGGLVYNNGTYNLISGHDYQIDVTVEGIFDSTNVSNVQFAAPGGVYSSYIAPTEQSKTTSGNGVYYVSFKFTMPTNFSADSFFIFFNIGNNYVQTFGLKRSFTITDLYDGTSVIIDQNTTIINQNDIIIDQNQQTNEELGDLNDSITSEEMPDTPDFSDIELADDTPISDLVLMPINYLNKLINAFSNQCSPYVLDFGILGSDYTLTLPCIKVENWIGTTAWKIVDALICFFMAYEIGMLAVKIFNDWTSMRDTYDSLYQPKHAEKEYQPKHGGSE